LTALSTPVFCGVSCSKLLALSLSVNLEAASRLRFCSGLSEVHSTMNDCRRFVGVIDAPDGLRDRLGDW